MLTIRLTRVGKKNKPMYRLTVAEKSKDPYGKALEILGSYNPHSKEIQVKADRIKYWISKGSGISPTANNLLIEKGVIEGEKVKASRPGKKKKASEDGSKDKPAPKDEPKQEGDVKPEPNEEKPAEINESETEEEKPKKETSEEPKAD